MTYLGQEERAQEERDEENRREEEAGWQEVGHGRGKKTGPGPVQIVGRPILYTTTTVAVSKITSRRRWCIESFFPSLILGNVTLK